MGSSVIPNAVASPDFAGHDDLGVWFWHLLTGTS